MAGRRIEQLKIAAELPFEDAFVPLRVVIDLITRRYLLFCSEFSPALCL